MVYIATWHETGQKTIQIVKVSNSQAEPTRYTAEMPKTTGIRTTLVWHQWQNTDGIVMSNDNTDYIKRCKTMEMEGIRHTGHRRKTQ